MARLPNISKYCVVRFDGALAFVLVEGVRHAHAFDRLLRDAVDHLRCHDARRFKDGRYDVDYVVELRADSADVVDVAGPGDGHALPGAAEVRRDLLGPFERRVEGPRPRHCHMRLGLVRTPDIVIFQLISDRHHQWLRGRPGRRACRRWLPSALVPLSPLMKMISVLSSLPRSFTA